MINRRIIITENQFSNLFHNGQLITENRASKNQSLARRMVRELSPNINDKDFTEKVLHDIPNVRKADFHLYPAVVRFVLGNGNTLNNDTIQVLNRYIGTIAPKAKEIGLDQNANGMDLQSFFNQFKGDVSNSEEEDREASAQYGNNSNGNYNGYKIVTIPNFEKANEYSRYTDWCVTQSEDAFSRYSQEESFLFLLKEGFENVPRKVGPNCPLDDYGLSMIAVSFRHDGSVNTVTCRWNHDNGGNDYIMTPAQVSNLIGTDVYKLFKPHFELLYTINQYGLYIYKDLNKNDLFVTNYNVNEKDRHNVIKFYFKHKTYTIFRGYDKSNSSFNLLISNTGKILEYSNGYNSIKCVQKDNLLFVNNNSHCEIYNLDTFKKMSFNNIDTQNINIEGQTIFLNNSNGEKEYILTGSNNGIPKFNRIIDILKLRSDFYIGYIDSDNNMTIIDNLSINKETIIDNEKIINISHGIYYCKSKEGEGVNLINYSHGKMNSDPITEMYQINYQNNNNGPYILKNQYNIIELKENGEFDKNLKSSDFNTMKSYNILRKVDMISTIKTFR